MSNNYTDMRDAVAEAIRDTMPEISEPVTLRDYFAAASLSGLIQTHFASGRFKNAGSGLDVCSEAYHMADAMLAERAK